MEFVPEGYVTFSDAIHMAVKVFFGDEAVPRLTPNEEDKVSDDEQIDKEGLAFEHYSIEELPKDSAMAILFVKLKQQYNRYYEQYDLATIKTIQMCFDGRLAGALLTERNGIKTIPKDNWGGEDVAWNARQMGTMSIVTETRKESGRILFKSAGLREILKGEATSPTTPLSTETSLNDHPTNSPPTAAATKARIRKKEERQKALANAIKALREKASESKIGFALDKIPYKADDFIKFVLHMRSHLLNPHKRKL